MTPRSLFYFLPLALALAVGCSATGDADGGPGRDRGPGDPGGPGSSTEDASVFDPGDDQPTDDAGDGGPVVTDARPDVDDLSCTQDDPPPVGPLARNCRPPTDNECDGLYEPDDPKWHNGEYGNGLDDDCDGIIDEGCTCGGPEFPVGTTRECWMVPPSQMDPATDKAVGWCENNSRGTVRCVGQGSGEFFRTVWDGECRGAQPPFADDVCAPGDFDCDGVDMNSQTDDCSCKDVDVICPSDPIVLSPYPDINNLPVIDGGEWIVGGPTGSTNWKWTVTGGDCDNILPHPTFAVYGGPVATAPGARISSDGPQTGLGPAGNQRGFVVGPAANVNHKIHPAFALSGDYLVKGEFKVGGQVHECTVKVEVRAPGIRTELCWEHHPSAFPLFPADTHDLDLHFARLQGNDSCDNEGNGWFYTCNNGQNADDCFYANCDESPSGSVSAWGYERSDDSACKGWGSRRDFLARCDNPRLDLDNIQCNPAIADPLNHGLGGQMGFCAPENINLDNPKNGDKFAVGVHYYSSGDGANPQPHVNIYCNGERKLAFGFDPTATPPVEYPIFRTPGASTGGDFWRVATIEAIVDESGTLTDCIIEPIGSTNPKPDKDGSANVCVDTNPQNAASGQPWLFTASGGYPDSAADMCWH